MKTIAIYLSRSVILAISLIVCVPVCNLMVAALLPMEGGGENSMQQIIAGITSETLRAFITVSLYAATAKKGSSAWHGIRHGLLYSALIGSLYLILGAFYFNVSDLNRNLLDDGFILIVQGIVSGYVLYWIFGKVSAS